MYHVILAGGSGTRFWPMSTHENPKQFLSRKKKGFGAKNDPT